MSSTYTREQLEDLKVKWDRMAAALQSEMEPPKGVRVTYGVDLRVPPAASYSVLLVKIRVDNDLGDCARGSILIYSEHEGSKGLVSQTHTSGSYDSRRLLDLLWDDLRFFMRLAQSRGSSRVA